MKFLIDMEVRARARAFAGEQKESIDAALRKAARREENQYDVFLSQTIKDKELVLGVYAMLTEDLGLTVFCDWVEKPEADRSNVTPDNARYIRDRMSRSKTLLFLDTQNADQSKWMCWELGWFDGAKGNKVGILPIVEDQNTPYREREFLGLYPIVERDLKYTFVVSLTDDQKQKIMRPGVAYMLATSFPYTVWANSKGLEYMTRGFPL